MNTVDTSITAARAVHDLEVILGDEAEYYFLEDVVETHYDEHGHYDMYYADDHYHAILNEILNEHLKPEFEEL